MNLNKAMIIGNLTRDPEIRTTPSGVSVASFSVATNMIWTDQNGQRQEKVEYHNIVAWRRLAEICGQYLKRGSKVYIEGRLQTRDWVGQDGSKKNRTEIIAENLIMLDRASQGQQFTPRSNADTSAPVPVNESPASENIPPADDEIRVEDIPF